MIFYCSWCREVACRDCILIDRRHSLPPCHYEPVKDAAKSCRESLRNQSRSLDDKKGSVRGIRKGVERLESTMKEIRTQYITDISHFYDQLIGKLKKRKEKAINQLQRDNQLLLQEIGAWREETKEYLSQIDQVGESIRSLSDGEILAQSKALKESMANMELKAIPKATKPAVPDIQSVNTILARLDADLPTYLEVDPDHCHITMEDQFQVNSPVHMYITLCDSACFPSSVKQKVSVSIIPSNDCTGDPLTAEVVPLSSSRYSVTFTPTQHTRGHRNIVIRVNKQILHKEPIFIECPPQELSHHLQTIDSVMYWGCLKISGQQVYCNTRQENGQPILARIDGDKLSEKYKLMIPSECKLTQWAPDEFAVNNDLLYVCDSENNKLHCFNLSDGSYVNSTGKRGTELGEFKRINGLCVAADSLIYVCDTNNNRIQVFDKDFRCLREFGDAGTEPSALLGPTNVVSVCEGGKVILYVSEIYNHRVQCLSSSGEHIRFIGGPGDGESQLSRPNILHIHHSHIYITDDRGVAVFTLDGQFVARFATELGKAAGGSAIEGLTVTKNGLVYIYHYGQSKIFIY